MAKINYSEGEIRIFQMDEEGRKYLEYNDKVGGEPLGLIVPIGYPSGFEKYGSVIKVYEECIRLGVTWEDLLDYHPPEDVMI